MKVDYESFFYSIAGCSATIIAIIGGFIASKLISISSDRDSILDKIKELDDELNMKTEMYEEINQEVNDYYALDFIRDNVSELVDNKGIDSVYKTEEKTRLDYSIIEQYWQRAIKICEEIAGLDGEQFCDKNSDKVPVVLAKKYLNKYDYEVCKIISREITSRTREQNLNLFGVSSSLINIVPPTREFWYQKKMEEVDNLKIYIEELTFEKEQYQEKKKQLRKPKGMKSGLAIFITFSICGVFFPLMCALLIGAGCINNGLVVSIIVLLLFGGCVLVTFIYMALLLRWKN